MVINKTLPSGPTQSSSDLEELKEENELLLLQLCQAQEELELWFTRFRELEAKNGAQQ